MKKYIVKKIQRYMILLGLLFISIQTAYADVPAYNPINAKNLPELINNVVRGILGIVGSFALFMFVYGGMLWLTSGGNTARIDKGKETLIWASIGLFVIFASYAILQFIFNALTGTTQ